MVAEVRLAVGAVGWEFGVSGTGWCALSVTHCDCIYVSHDFSASPRSDVSGCPASYLARLVDMQA